MAYHRFLMALPRQLGWIAVLLAIAGCQEHKPPAEPLLPPVIVEGDNVDPRVTELVRARTRIPTTLPAPRIITDETFETPYAQPTGGEKSTLVYTAHFAQPQVLREAIEGLISPEGSVKESSALNLLVVSDRTELIPQILKVLEELDRPVQQLLVEARVVEVALDSDLEYEIAHMLTMPPGSDSFFQSSSIELNTPGANPQSDQGSLVNLRLWSHDGETLDTFVRLLVSRGQAKLLSSPNLIVAPGTEASIITGEEVPVLNSTVAGGSIQTNTTFKRVGIKLRVNLLQMTGDTARVEINPEVSAVTGYTAATANNPANPIIAIRNVKSILSLKDGEILTVGGLLRSEERRLTRGLPILQDIPLLGYLFKSERNQTVKTQLIFFLRTSILNDGEVDTARIHTPGSGMDFLDRMIDGPATQPTDLNRITPPGIEKEGETEQ